MPTEETPINNLCLISQLVKVGLRFEQFVNYLFVLIYFQATCKNRFLSAFYQLCIKSRGIARAITWNGMSFSKSVRTTR